MKYTHIFVIIILALLHSSIMAYQPLPPGIKIYESNNGEYRLTVNPGDERNFFEKSIKGDNKSNQIDDTKDKCIGTLEKKSKERYLQIWMKELDNDVSPASALVSDSGKYVVTFDNWHLGGQGDNVIVIYNGHGDLIKKFSLDDFISSTEKIRLSRTFPSWIIFWGDGHEIDEENELLILKLLIYPFPFTPYAPGRDLEEIREKVNENEKWTQNNKTIRRIRLSDGSLLDNPIINKMFEYPSFECDEGQELFQDTNYSRIWQFCTINDENDKNIMIRHGKYQISVFVNGSWFQETRGHYEKGEKHGTWIQVFNEGDTPCVIEYDHGVIIKEECPQGWWGIF